MGSSGQARLCLTTERMTARRNRPSRFLALLRGAEPREAERRWIYVPYDQLSDRIGPLATEAPEELGVVLVENRWKAARRPYHKQKLALVLANMRHFALEQAARGVAVRYLFGDAPYAELLRPVVEELGPLRLMEPAERELRVDLARLVERGALEILPHEGWLTSRELFQRSMAKGPPWRMDAFYRVVRRESGVLMEQGKPVGGKFSFDPENRKAWKGEPEAPEPPRFEPDEVTREVGELVEEQFSDHPGELQLDRLPATADDAERLWGWAGEHCLPHFGPYEDAMSTRSSGLFHTRISPLLNLHRLLPQRVVDDVLALPIDLPSKEGFVRQVLGWREFVRHVHGATDGFRKLPGRPERSGTATEHDDGASPSFLDADGKLPPAFWGEPSGLRCLDHTVAEVWRDAYGHHITRLMVLSNLGTLLACSPRELTDWFWVAYADAYDWVVEPNVLGMGSYAMGDLMTTKPYVSGAAYIHRMSDFCQDCRFDPRKSCPITPLYWAFLDRNRAALEGNHRMAMPLRSLARRTEEQRAADRVVFESTRAALARGEALEPD